LILSYLVQNFPSSDFENLLGIFEAPKNILRCSWWFCRRMIQLSEFAVIMLLFLMKSLSTQLLT